MQTLYEQNRQRDYERYEQYRRFEEATDIAERIGYAIDHTVHYEMRDGLAYGAFDTKDRPFRAQTEQARREGHEKFTGVNKFEAIRREHEHQEALMVDAFGRGELDGTVLVKISMVPDAVRNGTADIDGYRRDLLRSFVRVYYRSGQGVSCRLFSLDQSDRTAMAAVGDFLGIATDGRSSEEVLADHALVNVDSVSHDTIGELVSQAKVVYDSVLERQTGKQFYAGSRMNDKSDALSLVMDHGALLDEHMRGITDIMSRALDPDLKNTMLENRRKRTAAAMDLEEQGVTVDSSSDAAVTEQMAAKEYGGECAIGSVSANAVGMSQGVKREREWKKGTCRVCFAQGTVGECFVCLGCEAADNAGKDLNKIHQTALARRTQSKAAAAKRSVTTPRSNSKVDVIKARFGEYARARNEVTVGGTDRIVYDSRTGETIAKL